MATFETLRARLDHLGNYRLPEGPAAVHTLSSYSKSKILEEVCERLAPLDLRDVWDEDDLATTLGRPLAADYETLDLEFAGPLGVDLAPWAGLAAVVGVGADGERAAELREGDFLVSFGGRSLSDILGGDDATEANFGDVIAAIREARRPAAATFVRQRSPPADGPPAPPPRHSSLRAAARLPSVRGLIKRCVAVDVNAAATAYDENAHVPPPGVFLKKKKK